MAVGFSLSQQRLDRDTRKRSKNPRAGRERRASHEAYEVVAERRGTPLPFARPATTRVPVTARERRKVEKQLQRDGYTTSVRKLPRRGWFW